MRSILFGLTFFFCFLTAGAQKYFASGKVVDSVSNKGIDGLTLYLFRGDTIVERVTTVNGGAFKFSLGLYNRINSVEIKSLSYKDFRYKKDGNVLISESNIDIPAFKLSAKGIDLQEVMIRRRKRYRDTATISLSGLVFQRNIMIDDLFGSNLGFTKDGGGLIYYHGKPISDIVVNGQEFFGKNNMEVFKRLPALTVDHITITETDIDSLTNTTLLKPAIKVNLSFKDKYNKGFFGSMGIGGGGQKKYISNGEISAYRKNKQLSLELGSNNINNAGTSFFDPVISFAPDGNNTKNGNAKLSYRDIYYKNKIELNILVRAKNIQKSFESVSEQQDGGQSQFSRVDNLSDSRSHLLDVASMEVLFKIDTLSSIRGVLSTEYNMTNSRDSLNYFISTENFTTISKVEKTRERTDRATLSEIFYQKMSARKKGRSMDFGVRFENRNTKVDETGNLSEDLNGKKSRYSIAGMRSGVENNWSINWNFIEPLNDHMYLRIISSYKNEKINYLGTVGENVVANQGSDVTSLVNQYIKTGFNLHVTTNKVELDGTVFGLVNSRTEKISVNDHRVFSNLDVSLNIEYKLENKRSFITRLQRKTNYPTIGQLTGINSSYDRISQIIGNRWLNPEIKNHIDLNYDLIKQDSLNLALSGSFDIYAKKFGMNISAFPGSQQISYIDNLGNVLNIQAGFNGSKKFDVNSLDFRTSITYLEILSLFNDRILRGKNLGVNQSFSGNIISINKSISLHPMLSLSYMRNFYGDQVNNQYSISYLDRLNFTRGKYEFTIYPMVNFNHSLRNNINFAANASLKKSIFNSLGQVWVQAYDVFNSFKYVNNINSATYIQSVSYANIQRYVLIGCSIKFNSMR